MASAAAIEFSDGSIFRISMKNFLTYDDVEVFPCANLNLIIGPNGTGKSTIVCAICLIFAGSPKILGRSSHFADYIKHGKDKANVEVEIVDKTKSSYPVIKLEIRSNNSCEFQINNKKKSKEEVRQFAQQYRIQVDNLCQFLAQDRVVEFSRQSPQELLENTEKTAGADGLYDQHQELKRQAGDGHKKREELQQNESRKEQLDAQLLDLQPEVKNARSFEERKERLQHLELKRPWMEYDIERKTLMQMKNELERRDAEIETKRAKVVPIQKKVTEITQKIGLEERAINKANSKVASCKSDFDRLSKNFADCGEEIKKCVDKLQLERDNLAQKTRQISQMKNAIEALRLELQNLSNDDADVDAKIQINSEARKQLENKINKAERERDEISSKTNELRAQIRNCEIEIRKFNDVHNQKLDKLRSFNYYSHQAYTYYTQHKNEYRGNVYLPILSVNVKNAHHCKFIEAVVPKRDWCMFLFEHFEDMQKFMKIFPKIASTVIRENAPLPTEQLDEEMTKMGFIDFLTNMFDAPDGVKLFLANYTRNVPIGSIATERNLNMVMPRVEHRFRKILTENSFITVSFSKYSKKSSVQNGMLMSLRILIPSVDEGVVRVACQEKETIEQKVKGIDGRLNAIGAKIEEFRRQNETLRQEKATLLESKTKRSRVQGSIRAKEQTLQRLERDIPDIETLNIEVREIKRRKINERKTLADQLQNYLEVYVYSCRVECAPAFNKMSYIRKRSALEEQAKEVKREFEEAERELKSLFQETEDKRKEVHELLATACRKNNMEVDKNAVLPEERQKIFKELPDDLDVIDQHITDLQAKLTTMKGVDRNALAEFKRKSDEKIQIIQRIDRLQSELDSWTGTFEEIRVKWVTAMEQLIETISRNFTKFLARLKCDGLVELDRSNDENDFASYGIKIKVKFRESETLRALTHQRQSGGERSVSTILYMLSLQELSHMPFRCVDEINQGREGYYLVDRFKNGSLPLFYCRNGSDQRAEGVRDDGKFVKRRNDRRGTKTEHEMHAVFHVNAEIAGRFDVQSANDGLDYSQRQENGARQRMEHAKNYPNSRSRRGQRRF